LKKRISLDLIERELSLRLEIFKLMAFPQFNQVMERKCLSHKTINKLLPGHKR
jgi:hypothetical protein